MNALELFSSYIKNEDILLYNNTSSGLNFNIRNLLRLIEMKNTLNTDFYSSQIECGIILFYKVIREQPQYKLYSKEIKSFLERQSISDENIESIKLILLEMQKFFFSDQEEGLIVIRNLG